MQICAQQLSVFSIIILIAWRMVIQLHCSTHWTKIDYNNKNTSAPLSRRKISPHVHCMRANKNTAGATLYIFVISNGVCDVPDTRAAGAFFACGHSHPRAVRLYYVQSMYLDWCARWAHPTVWISVFAFCTRTQILLFMGAAAWMSCFYYCAHTLRSFDWLDLPAFGIDTAQLALFIWCAIWLMRLKEKPLHVGICVQFCIWCWDEHFKPIYKLLKLFK